MCQHVLPKQRLSSRRSKATLFSALLEDGPRCSLRRPFIPEKKQALRTTYLNKVASTGPRSKIGREKLRELSGLDAVAFEALLPAKDYERVDW